MAGHSQKYIWEKKSKEKLNYLIYMLHFIHLMAECKKDWLNEWLNERTNEGKKCVAQDALDGALHLRKRVGRRYLNNNYVYVAITQQHLFLCFSKIRYACHVLKE